MNFDNARSKPKIALIGAGNIGGTLAHLISLEGLGDVTLLDLTYERALGKVLDIAQSSIFGDNCIKITAASNYQKIVGSDVIVVTAGVARKPGMSRDDLTYTNISVIKEVALGIKNYAPDAFVIVVTNPLDVMVYVMQHITKLPSKKIVGMAGVLDSMRFSFFLSEEFNVSPCDVRSFVLGGHGDSMVPLVRYSTVAGIPIMDLVKAGWSSREKIDEIVRRTMYGGAEIVNLLKTGSAFYAPASAILNMIKSYLFDQRKILSCAAKLNGEYNVHDGLYIGVPVIIGKDGIEKIVEINLEEDEQLLFENSVNSVRNLINSIDMSQLS